MGIRRNIAKRLRYAANAYSTPIPLARVFEALAHRVYAPKAMTCKICGRAIEYRGNVYEQAGRAYMHSEQHDQPERITNV
jgi:hypothetical protein